jgi:hypothetical protein
MRSCTILHTIRKTNAGRVGQPTSATSLLLDDRMMLGTLYFIGGRSEEKAGCGIRSIETSHDQRDQSINNMALTTTWKDFD